ncbi:MAG: alpha/beta hydrolase [Chloroflexus sp.]|uniref:alpha/beta fold hydrolase n=1 Tax=Chloroflexus sp. TaxID=1904827 RepID=UPI0030993A7E
MTTHTASAAETAVAGLRTSFRRAGQGYPLLLLHGWGGSSRLWHYTLRDLADRYMLIAPDLPGFGASPPLSGRLSLERLADWVIAFADALGLERFAINGHSLCAAVAVHVAARYPERVSHLIVTSFSTFRDERERRVVASIHHLMALWLALRRPWMLDVQPLMRLVGSRFFYRLPADHALLRETFADFLAMEQRTALETARGAGSPTISAALAAVRAPALLIACRHDQIMPPPGAPVAAARIPRCRLVWIEQCGHLPMLERPHEYHAILTEFLKDGSV